jgi:hypothetical protein
MVSTSRHKGISAAAAFAVALAVALAAQAANFAPRVMFAHNPIAAPATPADIDGYSTKFMDS